MTKEYARPYRETDAHLAYERDGGRTIPELAALRLLYDDITNDSVKCIFDRCLAAAVRRRQSNSASARVNTRLQQRQLKQPGSEATFRRSTHPCLESSDPTRPTSRLLNIAQAHMLYVVLAYCESDLLLRGFKLNGRKSEHGKLSRDHVA